MKDWQVVEKIFLQVCKTCCLGLKISRDMLQRFNQSMYVYEKVNTQHQQGDVVEPVVEVVLEDLMADQFFD